MSYEKRLVILKEKLDLQETTRNYKKLLKNTEKIEKIIKNSQKTRKNIRLIPYKILKKLSKTLKNTSKNSILQNFHT
jgi:hypothetical protein